MVFNILSHCFCSSISKKEDSKKKFFKHTRFWSSILKMIYYILKKKLLRSTIHDHLIHSKSRKYLFIKEKKLLENVKRDQDFELRSVINDKAENKLLLQQVFWLLVVKTPIGVTSKVLFELNIWIRRIKKFINIKLSSKDIWLARSATE